MREIYSERLGGRPACEVLVKSIDSLWDKPCLVCIANMAGVEPVHAKGAVGPVGSGHEVEVCISQHSLVDMHVSDGHAQKKVRHVGMQRGSSALQ